MRFKVNQTVLCEVNVWYHVDAEDMTIALEMVSRNSSPTSMMHIGDFEIVGDESILKTTIQEANNA